MQKETKLLAPDCPPPVEEGDFDLGHARERAIGQMRLLWNERRFVSRVILASIAAGLLFAFLLPKQYQATTQLTPPDNHSSSGMAMLAALTARTGNGLGAFAGGLSDMKSSGALFIGSRTNVSANVELRYNPESGSRLVRWIANRLVLSIVTLMSLGLSQQGDF